jgi:hypothetical protein
VSVLRTKISHDWWAILRTVLGSVSEDLEKAKQNQWRGIFSGTMTAARANHPSVS